MRYIGIVVCLLTLSGCASQGGGGSDPTGPDGGAGDVSPARATEVRVDRSFWHRGFKVTLGAARVIGGTADEPPVVTIEATFQNLSPEYEGEPTGYAVLTVGDRTYAKVDDEHQDVPEVPAQSSQPGTIAFEVDDHFVLKDAVLVVGRPDTRQAVVPLGRAEGLVSLEPRPVTVSGRVDWQTKSTFFMTVASGEVRADYPRTHQEAATGKEYLRLNFSATNNSAAGMAIVFDRDLTLKLPDGTAVGHDGNCSQAQIWPTAHTTADGGIACFLVPAPASGTYTLLWENFEKGALHFPVGG